MQRIFSHNISLKNRKQHIQDFKKKFLKQLVDEEIDINYPEAIKDGYCTSFYILNRIQTCVKEALLDSKDDMWLQELLKATKQIKNTNEISQEIINEKFILFLKKYPQVDSGEWIKRLEKGHCDGYSFLMISLFLLNCQVSRQSGKKALITAWSTIKTVFNLLSHWDGKRNLLEKDRKIISIVLQLIYYSQHSGTELKITWSDYHKILPKLFPLISSWEKKFSYFKEFKIDSRDAIALPLNKANILQALDKVSNNEILSIGADDHNSVIFQYICPRTHTSKYGYYDPNNFKGLLFDLSKEKVSNLVLLAHSNGTSFNACIFGSKRSHKLTRSAPLIDLDQITAHEKNDAMIWSIASGHLKPFRFWMKNVDINAKMGDGWSFLHNAVKYHRLEMVRELLLQKINVDEKTDAGRTPLMIAARFGWIDIAKELLKYHPLLNEQIHADAKKNQGYAALHLAMKYQHNELAKLLIDNGANTLVRTKDGKLPSDFVNDEAMQNVKKYNR